MNGFEKYQDEFDWLYMELYNDREKLNEIKSKIVNLKKERKEYLKKIDENLNSDWYKDKSTLGITLYLENFAKDINDLSTKVDYFKNLGINYIHIMPILKMPKINNDGGYAVSDFLAIDEKYGTNEDFVNFCKLMHDNNIFICLDFVMNHTSDEHKWAIEAKKGDFKYMGYYHIYRDRTLPDIYDATVPQVFPDTAPGNFTYIECIDAHVMTTFYPYQWDLNYANPSVFNEMLENMIKICNMGVNIIRLDAVPYIWKELYTKCRNLPKVHTIVRLMRMALEYVAPSCILKGEVVMAPHELAAYFGNNEKPECHTLYNVSTMVNMWSALASSDCRLLRKNLDQLFNLPNNFHFINYLRCHDDIGWGLDENHEKEIGIDPLLHKIYLYNFYQGNFENSYSRGTLYNYDPVTKDARTCGTTASLCGLESAREYNDISVAIRRIILMHALMLSIKGTPLINSGDEIAQLNDWSFENDETRKYDTRNIHRGKFDFERLKNASPSNPQGIVKKKLKELINTRKNNDAFNFDTKIYTCDTRCDSILCIARESTKRFICLYNFKNEPRGAYIPQLTGKYINIFTNEIYNMEDGIMMKPYTFIWAEQIKSS